MSIYGDLLEDDYDDSDDLSSAAAPDPVDTVAGPSTRSQAVADRIQQVRQGTAAEPSSAPPTQTSGSPFSPSDLAAMEYAHGAQQDASIGRALNSVASGLGAKVDNSGYDAMVNNANNTANKTMDRSAKVAQAIAGRDLKAKMLASAEDRFGRTQGEKERHNKAVEEAIRTRAKDRGGIADQKDAESLEKHLSQGWAGRSGQAGQVQGKINAAEAAEKLIEQGQSQQGGLDARQVEELAQSTGRLLGGTAQASARIDALVPHTLAGKAQSFKEWLTNEPQGQDMQAFVDRLAETVAREKELANTQKRQFQIEGLPVFARLKKNNPELYNSMLLSKGITPDLIDENSRYVAPKGAGGKVLGKASPDGGMIPSANAGDAPGGAHPQDSDALQWAKENPDDPDAKTILKLNGIK